MGTDGGLSALSKTANFFNDQDPLRLKERAIPLIAGGAFSVFQFVVRSQGLARELGPQPRMQLRRGSKVVP